MDNYVNVSEQKSVGSVCPGCGAARVFAPENNSLVCEGCGGATKITNEPCSEKMDTTLAIQKSTGTEHSEWAQENKVIECNTCGARIVLSGAEYSKSCPYCGSAYVVEQGQMPALAPTGIIPFTFSKAEAANLYKNGMKKKWFLPNAFKKNIPASAIRGIYIPIFAFDAISHSTYFGELEEDETVTKDGKTETVTHKFYIKGVKDVLHKDILIESSSLVTQAEFNSLSPFNTQKLVAYKNDYIYGYPIEQYDKNIEQCKPIADNIMASDIKWAILNKYHYSRVNYININTVKEQEKVGYYVMPIYKNEYTFKGKKYTSFMNGESGKVGGKVPRSSVKITFFVLFILAVIAALIAFGMLIANAI